MMKIGVVLSRLIPASSALNGLQGIFRASSSPASNPSCRTFMLNSQPSEQSPDAIACTMRAKNLSELDLLTLDAHDLKALLEYGRINSTTLVVDYLDQIERHNHAGLQCRAVLSLIPRQDVIAMARKLDEERHNGLVRGPFHGIPILIKDSIVTGPCFKVPTTVGGFAFEQAVGKQHATVVQQLIDQGLIVMGKAAMTQFCGLKGEGLTTGWSAINGQTQSLYIDGGVQPDDLIFGHSTPGGSSTGSAVSISAGFTPLAIGVETDGSVIQPAIRAALYALKPPAGTIPMDGVFQLSRLDSIGAMAKSSRDVAELLNVLMNPSQAFDTKMLSETSWSDLKIGFVDPTKWRLPEAICPYVPSLVDEMDKKYIEIRQQIAKFGAQIAVDVPMQDAASIACGLIEGGGALLRLIDHDFRRHLEDFVSWVDGSHVQNLQQLVDFIANHADNELPPGTDQSHLIDSLVDKTSDEEADRIAGIAQIAGSEAISKILHEYNIDVIVVPGDSPSTELATCAGYPVATVPVSTLTQNGRPFGFSIIAEAGKEIKLLQFMHAFEVSFPKRQLPSKLVCHAPSL